MPGETQYFLTQDGQLKAVGPGSVQLAQDSGWKPVGTDIEQARAARDAGGIVGQVKAGAQGLASGVISGATALPRLAIEGGIALGKGADKLRDAIAPLSPEDLAARTADRTVREAQLRDLVANLDGRVALASAQSSITELTTDKAASAAYVEAADQQRRLAEANPVTTFAATATGQALGAAAGGGAVGNLVKGGLAAYGASAIGKLGVAGLTMAVEGAPIGGVMAQDQAFLENRQLTGEQYWLSVGLGGMFSGALGVAGKGLGMAFGAGKNAVAEALATRAERKAASEVGADAAETALTAESPVEAGVNAAEKVPAGGEPPAEIAAPAESGTQLKAAPASAPAKQSSWKALMGADSDEAIKTVFQNKTGVAASEELPAMMRRAYQEGTNEVEATVTAKATRELTEHATKVMEAANAVTEEMVRAPLKEAHVAANLAKSGIGPEAIESASAFATQMRDQVRALAENPALETVGNTKTVGQLLKTLDRGVAEAASAETPAKAFMVVDQMRRDALNVQSSLSDSLVKSSGNVDMAHQLRQALPELTQAYKGAADFLADESVWGAQGTAQQEINQAWVRFIKAKDNGLGVFADRLQGRELDFSTGMNRPVYAVNEGKISGMIDRFGTPKGAMGERAFAEYLSAAQQLTESIGKHNADLPAAKLAELEALKASTAGAKDVVGKLSADMAGLNQVKMLKDASHTQGLLDGTWVGAAAKAMDPANLIHARVALESTAIRAKKILGVALDHALAPGSQAVRGAFDAVATGAKATAVPALLGAGKAPLVAFVGKHTDLQEAYRSRVGMLHDASLNMGAGVRDAAAEHFGSLGSTEPHAIQSAVVAATNGVNFLISKAPIPLFDAASFTPNASKIPISKLQAMEFATYWQAVMQPMSVVRALATDTLVPQQVEAIKAVYPSMYRWMQQETIARIRDLDSKGKQVPIRRRQMLDLLLDLHGAGDSTMAPEFGLKYGPLMGDGAHQRAPAPKPPGPSKLSSRLSTQTNQIIGGQSS